VCGEGGSNEDQRPDVNFDRDKRFDRPAAWKNMKAAMGPTFGFDRLARDLEQLTREEVYFYAPAELLAAAVVGFLESPRPRQIKMVNAAIASRGKSLRAKRPRAAGV
jgi:hypothetical protein